MEPVLNMLVFGESILNDAVAIVLTTTVIGRHRLLHTLCGGSASVWIRAQHVADLDTDPIWTEKLASK